MASITYWIFNIPGKNTKQESQNNEAKKSLVSSISEDTFHQQQKTKYESPVFKALSKKDWNEFKSLLDKQDNTNFESKLTQIIYFLDSNPVDKGFAVKFLESLFDVAENKKIKKARELQLLARLLGKLDLNQEGKKIVENFYKKQGLLKHKTWMEVSISWVPLQSNTYSQVSSLLEGGRDDLTAEFIYFYFKIKDSDYKTKLYNQIQKKWSQFTPDQKRFLDANIVRAVASTKKSQ